MPRGRIHIDRGFVERLDQGSPLPLLASRVPLPVRPVEPFVVDLLLDGAYEAEATVELVRTEPQRDGGAERLILRVLEVRRPGPDGTPMPVTSVKPVPLAPAPRGGIIEKQAPPRARRPPGRKSTPDYDLRLLWDGPHNLTIDPTETLGLFIATEQQHFEGERLFVRLTLPKYPPFDLDTEVRWLQQSTTLGPLGAGVRFLALDERARNAVESYARYRKPKKIE